MTGPWVSYYQMNNQQIKRSRREYQAYVFSKLVDDINVVLMEKSGLQTSELPKQQLTTSLMLPGSLALYISIGLSLVKRFWLVSEKQPNESSLQNFTFFMIVYPSKKSQGRTPVFSERGLIVRRLEPSC